MTCGGVGILVMAMESRQSASAGPKRQRPSRPTKRVARCCVVICFWQLIWIVLLQVAEGVAKAEASSSEIVIYHGELSCILIHEVVMVVTLWWRRSRRWWSVRVRGVVGAVAEQATCRDKLARWDFPLNSLPPNLLLPATLHHVLSKIWREKLGFPAISNTPTTSTSQPWTMHADARSML